MFRPDSVFMTEQKLKRLELCQQQTFTTLLSESLSGGLVNGCHCHPTLPLLSNFNNFFKDFPVKTLWPDQFTGAGRACFILKDIQVGIP